MLGYIKSIFIFLINCDFIGNSQAPVYLCNARPMIYFNILSSSENYIWLMNIRMYKRSFIFLINCNFIGNSQAPVYLCNARPMIYFNILSSSENYIWLMNIRMYKRSFIFLINCNFMRKFRDFQYILHSYVMHYIWHFLMIFDLLKIIYDFL